jgi:hypothetical protein
MSELEELKKRKQTWLTVYQSYALSLCLAVLDTGDADDLGDPDSVRRHHMIARSRSSGDVKIIATEKGGCFLPSLNLYADTRRVIVKVGEKQPVYMTFTNDPSILEAQYNVFVPGVWMDFADQVIKSHERSRQLNLQEYEKEQVRKIKEELLIGVPGFGVEFMEKEGEVNL